MEKQELYSVFESLITKHKTWWHDHQSYKECVLGSDGVGHDLIHPVDKLRASLRNLWTLTSACLGYKYKLEEHEIRLDEINAELSQSTNEFKTRRLKLDLEKERFGVMCAKMQLDDRLVAMKAFFDHSNELYEQVKDKYQGFDDALEDIWKARLAYNALAGGHPLGNSVKISLLEENKKESVLKAMGFPVDQIRTPNADKVLEAMETLKLKDGLNVEGLLDNVWESRS